MQDFTFWYTAIIILFMTMALIRELFDPEIIIFSALILLILGNVIDFNEAFAGFSNHGMLTVGFLFIIASSLQKTGILNTIGELFLGKRRGKIYSKLFRFLIPVSAVSAFFNNTPIVAMLIPTVRSWSRKFDYPLSKFLIPLSYAAILGGTCSLIGTSTNLVVHGLMLENGLEGFSLFEISKVGIPITLLGIALIALLGYKLLPSRKEPMVELGENTREFVIAMRVMSNYQFAGKTIEEAGLRHLKGLFLFQIERNDQMIVAVGPQEKIIPGDRLFFTGLPETIVELQRTPGLSLLKESDFNLKEYDSDAMKTFEAVISPSSPLIGQNVRESQFRNRYGAVIIAIHRNGERIRRKIGDVVLRAGDTLLLLTKKDFFQKWYYSKDFNLVSESVMVPSKPKIYAIISLAILVLMIVVMASGILPILLTVCIAAILLVVSKCITVQDAWKSVEWNVLLIIASAFGISRALMNSGVADVVANGIIDGLGSLGIIGLLVGVYFATSLYTEIITNNAAAAIMFPIAFALTSKVGIDPRPFFIAIMIAASASFATPIGYQTNLMVYGPGGYKFTDFMKIGIPMNLFVGIVAVLLIYTIFFG
jgi:di/tricarboxylate transporter